MQLKSKKNIFTFAPLSFELFVKVVKEVLVQKGTKQLTCGQHSCLTDEKKGNWISEDPHQRRHNDEEHDP